MRAELIISLLAVAFAALPGCGGGGAGANGASVSVGLPSNSGPVAVAGPDQVVAAAAVVALDGTGSYDADGDGLRYFWTMVSRPAASTAALSSTTTPTPVFRADAAGAYEIALEVTDDEGATGRDTVVVTASAEPVIKAPSNLAESAGVSGPCFSNDGQIPCPRSPDAPFYGQDAQYLTNPLSYTDNGDGTVTDDVTALVWQKEPDGAQYNWYEASGVFDMTYNQDGTDVCGSLYLGGYDDWRLPGRRELMGIVDYSRHPGFSIPLLMIDPSYFSGPGGAYWAAGGEGGWTVGFDDGVSSRSGPGLYGARVRCVRGPEAGGGAFTDNGDGTVTDAASGLVWLAEERAGVSWEGALGYCAGLALEAHLGHDDWRLPDIKELESIADVTRRMPALDSGYFTVEGLNAPGLTSRYWSSTAREGAVWVVSFDTGEVVTSTPVFGSAVNAANRARCVRSASGGG